METNPRGKYTNQLGASISKFWQIANWVQDKILPSGGEVERIVGCDGVIEAISPESVEALAAVDAAQGEDLFGAHSGPEHAGLFAACTDHGAATGLDHPRTNEVPFAAKAAVLH